MISYLGMRIATGVGLGAAYFFSPEQIYSLAKSVGFPPETAVQMTAIALRESGGNINAHNTTPPDDSYGLWQINMLGSLGDRRLELFGLQDKTQLFDPETNARAAYLTWGGSDQNLDIAWSIFSNPSERTKYLSHMPVAMAAAESVDGLPAVPDFTDYPASLNPSSPGMSTGMVTAMVAGGLFLLLALRS